MNKITHDDQVKENKQLSESIKRKIECQKATMNLLNQHNINYKFD